MGAAISTEIEVDAPPETVRSVFLDFEKYEEWNRLYRIAMVDPSKSPTDLQPGDQIKENSPNAFQWLGSLPGVFSGQHQFYFQPSQTTPGGTTLLQKEDFTGALSFLVRPGWSFGNTTQTHFDHYNLDLGAAAEKLAHPDRFQTPAAES